jgi:predicted nucleic acid-binding protein
VIFVDSNVFIYAVGRPHPLRDEAQGVFLEGRKEGKRLVTSAEVLQELLHAYLPVGRIETLDAALKLATEGTDQIFPISVETVLFARHLADKHPGLTARDLLHLSVCKTYGVQELKTFDRELLAASERPR